MVAYQLSLLIPSWVIAIQITVFFRRAAVTGFEFFVKETHVFVSDVVRDFGYTSVSIPESLRCKLKSLLLHKIFIGMSGSLLQKGRQVIRIHIE